MSSNELAVSSLIYHVATSYDGAIVGIALAYTAARSFLKFTFNSKALRKIRTAPTVQVSDLRSIVDLSQSSDENQSSNSDHNGSQKLVFVHGQVEAKSTVDGSWKSYWPNILVAHESGDKAVIIQRTQTCIYNQWKGLFGWTSDLGAFFGRSFPFDLRAIFGRSWREQESKSLRTVPFVLVEGGRWQNSGYIVVNMEGSNHPLPLTTVYHQLQPIGSSPFTFFHALLLHEYPVGLLDEEKILPVGKEINVVGMYSSENGIPEIKSCKDLPYFLSDMTKDQMVVDLAFKSKVLFWSGIVLGSLSIGILGYAVSRNWNKWKEWKRQRQSRQQQMNASSEENVTDIDANEEIEGVPDGELCVICVLRRRRFAFIPCGHRACCHRCTLSVERNLSPKCPLCRQEIQSSIRIYD